MTNTSLDPTSKPRHCKHARLVTRGEEARSRELDLLPDAARHVASVFHLLTRPRVDTSKLKGDYRDTEFVVLRSDMTADPGQRVGYRRILALSRDGELFEMRAAAGPPDQVQVYNPKRSSATVSSVLKCLSDALSEAVEGLRDRERRIEVFAEHLDDAGLA